MKKYILLSLLLALGWRLTAQSTSDYGAPRERADRLTERMQREIPLRPDQVPAVDALNLKYAERIQREIIDPGLSKVSAYFRGTSINKEKEKELRALLTEEQYESYEELRKKARQEILSRLF